LIITKIPYVHEKVQFNADRVAWFQDNVNDGGLLACLSLLCHEHDANMSARRQVKSAINAEFSGTAW
jgi:hypothetical protein